MTGFRFKYAAIAAMLLIFQATAGGEEVFVKRVKDGDTVILSGGEEVRLIGINTPEVTRYDKYGKVKQGAEPLAAAAKDALVEMVEGRAVDLVVGIDASDRYGRTLAHIDLPDATDVQVELLKRGLGFAICWPPNTKRIESHLAAEEYARKAKIGVWRLPYFKVREIGEAKIPNGFRRVSGVVTEVERRRNYINIVLNEKFTLLIQNRAWKDLWGGDFTKMVGRRIVARGWAYKRNKRLQMTVRHPCMMQIQN